MKTVENVVGNEIGRTHIMEHPNATSNRISGVIWGVIANSPRAEIDIEEIVNIKLRGEYR